MHRRYVIGIALLAALIVSITACSDDDDAPSESPSAAPPTQTELPDILPFNGEHISGEGIRVTILIQLASYSGPLDLTLEQGDLRESTTVEVEPGASEVSATFAGDWEVFAESPQFRLTADPDNAIDEANEENNFIVFLCWFEDNPCGAD